MVNNPRETFSTTKLIFEVRFAPKISFHGQIFEIASLLEDRFPIWETSGLDVAMKNEKLGELFLFQNKVWSFRCEQPQSFSDNIHKAKTIFNECVKKAGFERVLRLGVRAFTFRDSKMTFDETVKAFSLRTKSTELLRSDFVNDIVDDVLIFHIQKGSWRVRIQSGPCKPTEIAQHSALEIKKIDPSVLPDSSLWGDVDIGSVEFGISELDSMLEHATQLCINQLDSLYRFLEVK